MKGSLVAQTGSPGHRLVASQWLENLGAQGHRRKSGSRRERGVSPEPLLTAAGQDDHGEELLHTQARPERGEKSKSWVRPFHSPAAPGLLLPPRPH